MLVSKIKPCMSKYKLNFYTVKLRMAHYISYNLFDGTFYYLDNRGNSRANTCYKSQLLEGTYLLDPKPMRVTSFMVNHNNFSNRMALC
jgi:hypothetical protein